MTSNNNSLPTKFEKYLNKEQLLLKTFEDLVKTRSTVAKLIPVFQELIYHHYTFNGRKLKWRSKLKHYYIFISEIMLQQTQVDRVKDKFEEFIQAFPDFQSLADASLHSIFKAWQGLGYNRRALGLKRSAEKIMQDYGGRLPRSIEELEKLYGVGPATARSIYTFAYNKPEVFIETNIRTVFIFFFFRNKNNISDAQLLPLIEKTLDKKHPRQWYYALMDYGVVLKRKYANPNRKSRHYTKQSRFEGSNRQIRGLIVKTLVNRPSMSEKDLFAEIDDKRDRIKKNLYQLQEEGLIRKNRKTYSIS